MGSLFTHSCGCRWLSWLLHACSEVPQPLKFFSFDPAICSLLPLHAPAFPPLLSLFCFCLAWAAFHSPLFLGTVCLWRTSFHCIRNWYPNGRQVYCQECVHVWRKPIWCVQVVVLFPLDHFATVVLIYYSLAQLKRRIWCYSSIPQSCMREWILSKVVWVECCFFCKAVDCTTAACKQAVAEPLDNIESPSRSPGLSLHHSSKQARKHLVATWWHLVRWS